MAPSPERVAILLPLGIAVSITFCTVIIHALAMMAAPASFSGGT